MMVLIIGASSAIAKALIEQYRVNHFVVAVSRTANTSLVKNVEFVTSNYDDDDIAKITNNIIKRHGTPKLVFICNGTLHNKSFFPEKRLEDISSKYFEYTYRVNFLIPVLWMKSICSTLPKYATTTIVAFSARVGSISDNKLGGWYAYRSSKAALNMFIQTLAVELARRSKSAKLLAFHPGTTDSPLSEPFQGRVAKNKIFTPTFVAKQLVNILDTLDYQGSARFIDWAGKPIPW